MYGTERDCVDSTNNCDGHGQCVQSGESWDCQCVGIWNNANCSQNFFKVYQGRDAPYYVIGLLGFVPLLVISILEITKHLQKEANTRSPAFATKMMVPIISLFRIWHFCLYAYQSSMQTVVVPLFILDSIIFNVALCAGIATYLLVMYSWIVIVIALKSLSMKKSQQFQLAQKVIFTEVIIFTPVAIILGILITFLPYAIIPLLYGIWLCLFILVNFVWSLVQIIYIFQEISSMKKEEKAVVVFKKKNILFLLCSLVLFFGFLILFSGIFIELNRPWTYFAWMLAMRLMEIFACYFFFIIVEGYTLSMWYSTNSQVTNSTPYSK